MVNLTGLLLLYSRMLLNAATTNLGSQNASAPGRCFLSTYKKLST